MIQVYTYIHTYNWKWKEAFHSRDMYIYAVSVFWMSHWRIEKKNVKKIKKKKKEKKRNRISRCVFPHFRLNILNLEKKQFSIFRFNINFKYKVSCFTSFIIIHHIASLLLPTRAYLDPWKTNRVTDRRTSILFVWIDYCNLVIMIYIYICLHRNG